MAWRSARGARERDSHRDGAPIPEGADAVVPVEQTTPLDSSGTAGERGRDAGGPVPTAILVHGAVAPGAHVRRRGSDLAEGDEILMAGSAMSAGRGRAGRGRRRRLDHRPAPSARRRARDRQRSPRRG